MAGAIVAMVVIVVVDVFLLVNAMVDGKYLVEPYAIDCLTESYYLRVGSLAGAMFINAGISILFLVLWIKKRRQAI